MNYAQLYHTDGTITQISPINGSTFTDLELVGYLSCTTHQIMSIFSGNIFVVANQALAFKGQPYNANASSFINTNGIAPPGTALTISIYGAAIMCDQNLIATTKRMAVE